MADKGIAYAFISDGASASVLNEYSFNPGGGPVAATRQDTGRYKVVFPNTGFSVGWSVQSTAVGDNADYCNTFQFGGGGVIVTCADSSGVAVDSPFTVLAISNNNDKNISFAYANQPSTASYTASADYSHNPSGAITITRSEAGTYQVLFAGLSGTGGSVQVGAVGTASCHAGSWEGATLAANVFCLDTGGNPVDSPFFIDAIPAGVTPTGVAYGLDTQPAVSFYTTNTSVVYNPVGVPVVPGVFNVEFDHVSAGKYVVTFNGLNALQVNGGNVRATAVGSAARCKVSNWQAGNWQTGPPGSDLQVFVACYNLVGGPVDTEYTVLALPAMGYAYAPDVNGVVTGVASFSVNPGGGPVTSTHDGTGQYHVTFSNSGIDAGWIVQAIAADTSYDCIATSWALSTVYVRCYSSGSLADASFGFGVLAISSTNDKNIAFAKADQPSAASYTPSADFSYNPVGTITVTRFDTGSYQIVFNGLSGQGSTVQVATAGFGYAHCTLNSWGGNTLAASVQCYDQHGNAADASFSIVVIPGGVTPSGIAFGWANQPSAASYQAVLAYPAGAGVSVIRTARGQYQMLFPGLDAAQAQGGYASVTPRGTKRCSSYWGNNGSTVKVLVDCDDDTEFVVLLFPPVVGPPAYFSVQAGSPQSAMVYQAFGLPLKVSVSDDRTNPVPNVRVLFSVPNSGASASFTQNVDWADTNSTGVATSHLLLANSTSGGPYAVKATIPGVNGVASFSLTNLPATAVTLQTSPPGLSLSFDGVDFAAPITYQLATGSTETIGAPLVQVTAGTKYTWQSWSDNLGISHNIIVPLTATTYTANFSSTYQLTTAASPPAGGTVAPVSGTFYNPDTVVPLTATANGGYSFGGWTGGVANASSASTSVTMSAPQSVTANFLPFTNITIQTNPSGLQFSVDGGAVLVAPQTLSLSQGSHMLAVISTQAGAAGTQYVFTGWNDGSGVPSRGITVGGSAASYTAAFATQYRLTIATSPVAGGTVTPDTGTFYYAGLVVTVTATANSGYSFNVWSGTVGNANSASTTVTMSAPASVTANFLPLTSIAIQTKPSKLRFSVDGGPVQLSPQTLNLSQGSHTIAVGTPQAGAAGIQYVFSGWNDTGAPSHDITVGASAATYTATFKTQYQLTIAASPPAGGTVTPASATFYDAGTVVPVVATVNGGYTFGGWSGSVAVAGNASTSVTMSAPESVTANFLPYTTTTIQTNPSGLQFSVDGGAVLTAPQTLSLSQGAHTLAVVTTQAGGVGTQYLFTGWNDSGAPSHGITVAGAAATYTASFTTQYQLTIGGAPPAGGTMTPASGTFYDSGTVVPVTAAPNGGYTFGGWTGTVANANNASTTVTMSAPESVTANFLLFTNITVQTNPAGLQFSVDGAPPQTAPQTLTLSQGPHTLAVVTTQAGAVGTQYVFTGWNDSGAASHGITVAGAAATYTSSFTTQYQLTIAASPVAGGTVTPASGTFYDAGTVVPVAATANGGYTFNGWSGTVANANNASTTVTMSAPQTVTVNFLPYTNITIQTNPAALQFSVDGAPPQTAPQTLSLPQGAHTFAVVTTQAGGAGTQYVFTGWNDSGTPSHGITVGGSAATYTASFKTQYQLTMAASPGSGGVVGPTTGQFYDSGTSVSVSAVPNPPYAFLSWSGGATGSSNPTSVTMTGPRSVSGNFAIPPCQPTGNFGPGVADVQLLINEALGGTSPIHDLNLDGAVDLVDIQIELNAVLGMGCTTR